MQSTRKYSNLPTKQEIIPSLPKLMNGLRKFSHHVQSRKQIITKNQNNIEEQKLQEVPQLNLYSPRDSKNYLLQSPKHIKQINIQQQVSPKLLSPRQQGEMIEYLQKKNEQLINENKQKQQLINQLLTSSQQQRKINRLSSPQNELKINPLPRSAETKRELQLDYRLPIINKQRIELLNKQYNLSFGKQEDPKEKLNTQTSMKSHFSKLLMKLPQEFRV